jgi:hypothetical protein
MAYKRPGPGQRGYIRFFIYRENGILGERIEEGSYIEFFIYRVFYMLLLPGSLCES